jgi:hypothetical protein
MDADDFPRIALSLEEAEEKSRFTISELHGSTTPATSRAENVGGYARHEDCTHLGLGKERPGRRIRSVATGHIISDERLGGLHHRYDRAA